MPIHLLRFNIFIDPLWNHLPPTCISSMVFIHHIPKINLLYLSLSRRNIQWGWSINISANGFIGPQQVKGSTTFCIYLLKLTVLRTRLFHLLSTVSDNTSNQTLISPYLSILPFRMYVLGSLLLQIVSIIMQSFIRSENGGLLNVIFQPDGKNPTSFVFNSKIDYDYLRNILLFKSQPFSVLEVLPESLGGGLEGAKSSQDHGNLEGLAFWIPTMVFFLLAFLILIALWRTCYLRGQVNVS